MLVCAQKGSSKKNFMKNIVFLTLIFLFLYSGFSIKYVLNFSGIKLFICSQLLREELTMN